METLQTILTVFIWFLCPILILLILVQGGAGDLSSTFGGGGQLDSTLGVGASRKMGKMTGWLSFAFLMIVLFMAIPPGGTFAAQSGPGDAESESGDPTEEPADAGVHDAALDAAVEGLSLPPTAETAGTAKELEAPVAAEQPAADAPVAEEPAAGEADAGLEIDVGAQPEDEE